MKTKKKTIYRYISFKASMPMIETLDFLMLPSLVPPLRLSRNRSVIIATAVDEYLRRHHPDLWPEKEGA